MRAVGGTGPAESLFIGEADTPQISDEEILVKVAFFGLNRMDLMQREGNYPVPPQAPKTLGVEFSGTVAEVGASAQERFKKGDAVFGLAYGGAYAEYVAVAHRMVVHKPDEISFEEASAIPETWITALQAMYLIGEFAAGKTILWHAGASSVSIAGVQLAKAYGAKAIYVTAGSQEKIDFCVSLGATAGFNYHKEDWSKKVLEATDNQGVDVIVDFIGANYFQGDLNAAAKDARIVLLATMSGYTLPEGVNILPLLLKRIRFEGSTLRSRTLDYQSKLREMLCEKVVPKVQDKTFKVPIEKVFSWTEVAEAHKFMESNTSKGKILCRVE